MVLHHRRCSITGLLGELCFLVTRAQASCSRAEHRRIFSE